MLTDKDKAFLGSLNWKWKDIEYFENDLREGRIREPYFIRSAKGKPLAEVYKVKKEVRGSLIREQCLNIF